MKRPSHFISCDWGTTNFRLRVVETSSLEILAEHQAGRGVRTLNGSFMMQKTVDRVSFFTEYLWTQIAALPAPHQEHPIVVSGMASANIGLQELPYGVLPIDAAGTHFVFQDLLLRPDQPLRLISGVKSDHGMMRGEETQALGLLELMQNSPNGTLLLPGTHSKHLTFQEGKFTDFTSFMTGELFEILTQHSILKGAVSKGAWDEEAAAYFQQGVMTGYREGCTPHLFGIRVGQLLRQTAPAHNFYQLSGLLIGDELSHLPKDLSQAIYLAGSGPLFRLYRLAIEITEHATRLTAFGDELLSKALLSGQRTILSRMA